MTTLNDTVLETYRRAMSSMREETNTLASGVGPGATALAINGSLGSIAPAAIVQVDYELFNVQSSASPQSIGVVPGYLDSSTAAHAEGAVVTVNPRFPAVDIIKAANETLDQLSAPTNGLYQAQTVTVTYNPVLVGYDLTDANTGVPVDPADFIDLIEVRVHEYGPFNKWPVVPLSQLQIVRNADTGSFPSGIGLIFMGGGYPGRPIRVVYKAPYNSTLANPADDVQAVSGLHAQAHDILTLGAALRLMGFREFKRSFTESQSEPRKAQEVPVGSSLTAVKLVMQLFESRVDDERARLDRQYRMAWR